MKKIKNRYNLANITDKILNSGFILFDNKTLKDIFQIEKKVTFFSVLKKIVDNNILIKIERGKYLLASKNIETFNIANLLYTPSYISFETALNFYGILSQFPYEITSVTTKKSINKKIEDINYSYVHVKNDLFFGYEKKNGILIAEPEKALLDQMYLASKGLKKINIDEYDFSIIKKGKLREYYFKYSMSKQNKKMTEIMDQILNYDNKRTIK